MNKCKTLQSQSAGSAIEWIYSIKVSLIKSPITYKRSKNFLLTVYISRNLPINRRLRWEHCSDVHFLLFCTRIVICHTGMWNQYCIDLLLRSYNIIVVCCHHNEWFFARPKSYWSNFFAPLPLLLFHFLLNMLFSGRIQLNSQNLSILFRQVLSNVS